MIPAVRIAPKATRPSTPTPLKASKKFFITLTTPSPAVVANCIASPIIAKPTKKPAIPAPRDDIPKTNFGPTFEIALKIPPIILNAPPMAPKIPPMSPPFFASFFTSAGLILPAPAPSLAASLAAASLLSSADCRKLSMFVDVSAIVLRELC